MSNTFNLKESYLLNLGDNNNTTINAVDKNLDEKNKTIPKESKQDFEDFKTQYKGVIDMKCSQDYGNSEDKDLWEDCAKELFLKSKNYILLGDEYEPKPLEKKTENKQLTESNDINVGDEYINDYGAKITILEPTKDGEYQFKVTNTKTGVEGDVLATRSMKHVLDMNGYKKVESKNSTDNYQIRKYPNEDEFKGTWGLYDLKQDKFIQKGSKYVMQAALKDITNKQLNEADMNVYKDKDEADYYRYQELYSTTHLARHYDAMKNAEKACKAKGIKLYKNADEKYDNEKQNNLAETKENDLSKDLYQDEANRRILARLRHLDIYLEELQDAMETNNEDEIIINKSKIKSNVEYLIPALNIKDGVEGLIKYLIETNFDFENKFKETANLLNKLDESKQIKTEALNYENLVVLNNLGDTQFVKARKDKEDKEFKKSGAVMISKDAPNSLKNAHDLAIRAQSCIYKLEDIQSELNKLAPTTNYDVENINRILADYGFDAYVTDLYRKNLGNLDDVNSCQNFVSILINQLQQIKEKDLNESKIIENNKEKDPINVFSKDSEEYKRLQKVCDLLNERTNENVKFTIEETHFDYGQNWKWTTIITKDLIDGNSWQTLNPRQQEEIINGKNPDDIINTILSGMLYKNFKLDKINEGLDDWDLKAKDLEKKFKDAYEEYKKNNKYPLSYLDWNNLLTTKDKEKIIAGNKKTESKVDNLVLNQFRNIIDLADKGYKVDLIAADGTKVSFDEEDLKAMYTGLVGNDNDLIKLPSEENPEETRNFIQSQLDKSYNKKYESRPDKDAVTEARQVKTQEDQYENERRKGRPNINKIAEAEFYDNQDWYIQHIKDYKDEKDFIEKEKAEIAFEYNLTEIRSELVCKQIYQLAKENDLI